MKTITIVLADDHHIVRQGFRSLPENQEGFSVVAEAGDGLEAVKVTAALKPDVLVVDLVMPCLNGLEVTRQIAKLSPDTKAIILGNHGTPRLRHTDRGRRGDQLAGCAAGFLNRGLRRRIGGDERDYGCSRLRLYHHHRRRHTQPATQDSKEIRRHAHHKLRRG